MKKTLAMMGMMVLVSACNDMSGSLNVMAPSLQMMDKNGNAIELASGQQAATLSVSSDKIQIKVVDAAGKKQTIQINVPGGEKLPTSEGSFELKAADTKQLVDVKGSVGTTESRGAEQQQIQNCNINVTITRCQDVIVKDPKTGKSSTVRQCQDVTISHPGQQLIRFHSESSVLGGSLVMSDPASGAIVAQYDGAHESNNIVNDFVEACH